MNCTQMLTVWTDTYSDTVHHIHNVKKQKSNSSHFTGLSGAREKTISFYVTERNKSFVSYCKIRNVSRNPSKSNIDLFVKKVRGWKL